MDFRRCLVIAIVGAASSFECKEILEDEESVRFCFKKRGSGLERREFA